MNSYIFYNNVSIPPNSMLAFSTAIDPAAWNKTDWPAEGVTFQIFLQNANEPFFSEYISQDSESLGWFNHELPFPKQCFGRNISISLGTNPFRNTAYDWAVWGDPIVSTRNALSEIL